MLHRRFQQVVALILTAALLLPMLPPEVLAHYADPTERPDSITTTDGATVPVTEDWETAFPYGTFAFGESEAQVTEDGDTAVIRLYRLGGTKGRATATVVYVPAVLRIAEDAIGYGNAAGLDDIVIEVEDPLPIAQYQPLGKDPEPEPTEVKLADAADAETGDHVITLTEQADSYQWYILSDGVWEPVTDAVGPEFVISADDLADRDVRCVFSADGVRRCTDSVKGEAYEMPEPEALEEIPEDLPLNPDPTFTRLTGEAPYDSCAFSLTFAEDEWVKDIRVTAVDDAAAEAIKAGTFTIVDCEGGTLYDSANTLALAVFDNDAPEESVIGFSVTRVEADKSDGSAVLTVTRTGGTQTMVTVPYSTKDGTAVAGEDYQAASGSLAFFADVTEQTIEIPLIDSGEAEDEPVEFFVELGDVVGDNQGLVTMAQTLAAVSLTNSNTARTENLATLLRDGGAVDASGSVTEAETVAAPVDRKTVTGTQVTDTGERLSAEIIGMEGSGGMSLQTYDYGRISFSRGSIADYYGNYWQTNLIEASGFYPSDQSEVGAIRQWSGDGENTANGGRKIEGQKGGKSATLTIPYMSQMYSYVYARFGFGCAILNTDLYGAEFVYPWGAVRDKNNSNHAYADANMSWDWGLFTGYHYTWKTGGSISHSFDMSSNLKGITIGLSRHDAHDADKRTARVETDGIYLTRRSLNNDLQLRIHTANDGENSGNNVATAPLNAASLSAASGVYGSMKPEVIILQKQGGVTTAGKLYVGSTVRVNLKSTDSYHPKTLAEQGLNTAVYISDENGNVVSGPQIQKVSGTDSYDIRMVWDGMRESDLSKTYVINVVMTRRQELKLDLSPSVERQENNPSAIDASKIGKAWELFWNNGGNAITYGYSEATKNAPHFSANGVVTGELTAGASWGTDSQNSAIRTLSGVENLQWINFNRSEEDRILYNGRIYAGNETIWLDVADLALPNATFRYYQKDFLSATSIMTTDINSVGVYLDANGNGQIDGYFNEGTSYFILDDDADIFVQFLAPDTDYDEATFAPVKMTVEGEEKYVQYFAKVFYTMTPRALIPPAGMDLSNEKAQVIPAFVTNVTDPDNYARLTREQQSYRYIFSGMNRSAASADDTPTPYARSSDGHAMYGGEAGKPQVVDVPLGGDVSPARLNVAGDGYEWTPDYQGNLLVDFAAPEPISVEHSLAGDDIPIANYTVADDGTVALEDGGAAKLNGYLGSFTANSTITLCTQRQEKSADELHTAVPGSMKLLADEDKKGIDPEASNLSTRGSFPNSEYLKAMEAGQSPEEGAVDMGESPNQFDELNVDLGVKLPSTDIGITDFVTVIMDGYEVGFAIGIPLASASSKEGFKGIKDTYANKGEDMGKVKNFLQNRKGGDVDDSFKNASKQNPSDGDLNMGGVEASLSVSIAFLFKYNSVDNGYYFSQFAISLVGSVEFKYQHRFKAAPVIYLYVKVGGELKLGTGATVERETVESDEPWKVSVAGKEEAISQDHPLTLKKGTAQYFLGPQYKAQNITFSGKIAVQLQKQDGESWRDVPDSVKGYLKSDGGDPVTVTLLKQDKMELPDKDTAVYRIKLTALEDSTVTGMVEVTGMSTKSYWSGFDLEPSVFVEAGAGIGIEILKFELFIKVSVECAMKFGVYNTNTDDYDGFEFESFSFALGLGFRVVLLVINYEMDLIGYSVDFDQEKRDTEHGHSGWSHSWHALGDLFGGEIDELSAVDGNGGYYGVRITLPGDASRTQTIYSNANDGGLSLLAYTPADAEVPFQYSGYGSSGDAFKLADGLITGYDYQVVTVGDANYLIYTISRKNAAHAVDNTMLVLSRLQLTSAGGRDAYGLVNPLDASDAAPYILLDTLADGSDDGAGDLDFRAWADGDVIHAAWVSYATKASIAAVRMPDETLNPVPREGGTEMDETNYTSFTAPAVPSEPAVVANPGPAPETPDETAYYTVVTAAAYEALDDAEKADYVPADGANTSYAKAADGYADYAGAKAAYDDAVTAYSAYQTALTAYNSYLDDKRAYDAAKADYDAFMAWYHYFDYRFNVQAIAANAAKNTVVRTASFDTTGGTGFTAARTVSGATGALVYLPGGEGGGDVTVYARAVTMDDLEKSAARADYTAYLAAIGYDPDGAALTGDQSAQQAKRTIGSYRLATQVGLWDAYGKGSELYVSVDGAPCANPLRLAEGQILDNFEVTSLGDVYYLAYTTSEKAYMDGGGHTVADAADAEDMVTIKRLFLRTFTVDAGGVTWTNHGGSGDESKAVLLRTLYDFDVNAGSNRDGVYTSGGTLTGDAYNDPYFSNLKFLSGRLGDSLTGTDETFALMDDESEAFLLFEMNGASFVIREASLRSIVGSSHTGQIIPFFAAEDGVTPDTHAESTGRSQVTIGADGDGNLSAVYVAPVTGTGNNAVYLSKYDPATASWGAGTMLAMNHMDVYEDSLAAGWDAEALDKAYRGVLDGYGGGAMDEFTFGNLQIALGQTKPQGGAVDSASSGTGAEAARSTLLILAQGTTSYLDTYSAGGKEYVGRMNDADAAAQYRSGGYWSARKPGVGVYALSFGVGGQAIGEASLTFDRFDFTAGAYLYSNLSFTNTGDVGIRASKAQPVTVTLNASGDGLSQSIELARWTIEENIVPGQRVRLEGGFTLETTLPQGTVLSATVTEHDAYRDNGGMPYCASTGELLKVEDRPELGFESLTIRAKGVDESGNTVLQVNGLVGNRGTKDASGVTLQFSYDNGTKDAVTGNPVFEALELTGNTLQVGEEKELTLLSVPAATGALSMGGIGVGKGRTVKGEITVSADKFTALTDSLSLRAELFCDEDPEITTDGNGVLTARHADYNDLDNLASVEIEHDTFFSVANKVVVPMGNTMRLPVSVAATTGKKAPQIAVTEFPDAGGGSHLGVLYYQSGAYANGHDNGGALVFAPSSIGSGLIRVQDANTNGFFDVAYTVTEASEGINVFNDTTVFTFYNDTGKTDAYDPTAPAGTQSWFFNTAIDKWGADETAPYLDNLARGRAGACFTFDTQAESIDLIFGGRVKVESTFPGFAARTIEANGGDGRDSGEHASVRFGTNATNYTHTVTVTVLSGAGSSDVAAFDRIVEHFGSAGTPVPAEDAAAPHIYWSRSFPDTASIVSGEGTTVELTAFVVDDGQLASVTLNGETYTRTSTLPGVTIHGDGYWELSASVEENGLLQIAALDTAGNRTAQSITVDWFNTTLTVGASAQKPTLTMTLKKTDKTETEVSALDPFTKDDRAFIDAVAEPSLGRAGDGDAAVSVAFIAVDASGSGLSDDIAVTERTEGAAKGMYPMASNGWYLVTARNPEPHGSEFASEMVQMDRIDTNVPVVTLSADGGAAVPVTLDWSVTKQNTGTVRNTIRSVTVNGMDMAITDGQTELSGSFLTSFGGLYTAVATDTAGITGESDFDLRNIPIVLADGKTENDLFTVRNAAEDDAGSKANGVLTLSGEVTSVLAGGTYDKSLSDADKSAGRYVGRYEWKLTRGAEDVTGWIADKEIGALEPGQYTLLVRDAQEPDNDAVMAAFPLTVGDETITVEASAQSAGQNAQGLHWTVAKGDGAILPITAVAVNGFTVYTESTDGDTGADGSFPLAFAGDYRVTATDGVNTAECTVAIGADDAPIQTVDTTAYTDDPLSTADDSIAALVTMYNPWNQTSDNGTIRIDPSVLTGGEYDAGASDPAANRYQGSYEWTLSKLEEFDRDAVTEELVNAWLKQHPGTASRADIPDADMDAIRDESDRLRQEAQGTPVGGAWSSENRYEALSDGAYRLTVRDRQNPDSTNALSVDVRLESDTIRLTASAVRANSSGKNGQVSVSASGGYGHERTYEFILRPIPQQSETVALPALDDALDAKQYPDRQAPAWLPAKLTDNAAPNLHVFDALDSGWYQVAVRPMLGVTLEDMTELIARYTVYANTAEERNAAEEAATDRAKADAAKRRIEAVGTALSQWRRAEDSAKDEAWNSYLAAFGVGAAQLDPAVQTAFDAWQAASFARGAERDAYDAAVRDCVTSAISTAADAALAKADADAQTAGTSYETLLNTLQSRSALYYASDDAVYWDNAATETIYVDRRGGSGAANPQENALSYPDEDTVKVTFLPDMTALNEELEKKLVQENAKKDILAESAAMSVRIPRGTLSEGDKLNPMLMPFADLSGTGSGAYVVICTDGSGASEPVAWSRVGSDRVEYIASKAGGYGIARKQTAYTDVPETFWGYDDICFVTARGLFNGVSEGVFDPKGKMTRAMFVTVLGRMAGADAARYAAAVFDDVDPASWYGPYVAWAAERGVVKGVGEGLFAPQSPVTREQICTILCRYLDDAGLKLPKTAEPTAFPDADRIHDWSADSVSRFQQSGIVRGDNTGRFNPEDSATRAEASAILARTIKAVLAELSSD